MAYNLGTVRLPHHPAGSQFTWHGDPSNGDLAHQINPATPTPDAIHLMRTHPAALEGCLCVRRHAPEPRLLHWHHLWPAADHGPTVSQNLIPLCPSAHANVHQLLRAYQHATGQLEPAPPWNIREHFNPYTRLLAHAGHQATRTQAIPNLQATASLIGYSGPLPSLQQAA